jgi:YVTN family beta-propeller protein
MPDGQSVYVANHGSSTLSIISTATNSVTGTITLPFGAHRVHCNPNGEYVYASEKSGDRVAVVRVSDNTVVATFVPGTYPCGMVCLPSGDYLYTGNNGSGDVSIVRTSDNTVVKRVACGNANWSVAAPADGRFVAACSRHSHAVYIIGRSTGPSTNPTGEQR